MQEFARQKALPAPVPLVAGLALLPLRDEDMDSFLPPPLTGWHEDFASLTDQLMSELGKASRSGLHRHRSTEDWLELGER